MSIVEQEAAVRRWLVLILLLAAVGAVYVLNRAAANWHYVLPAIPGETLYVSSFDGFGDEWSLTEGRLRSEILPEGILRLTVNDSASMPFVAARPYVGDFDLQVEARAVEGPIDNAFGVIFRLQNKRNNQLDDDDFMMFLISSDGYYQVLRQFAGEQKELSTWIPSEAIRGGIGAANWLRVVAQGGQFRFFVNGTPLLLCIPDDPAAASTYLATGECRGGQMLPELIDESIATGQFGLVARSYGTPGVVVEFDNLLITGPQV